MGERGKMWKGEDGIGGVSALAVRLRDGERGWGEKSWSEGRGNDERGGRGREREGGGGGIESDGGIGDDGAVEESVGREERRSLPPSPPPSVSFIFPSPRNAPTHHAQGMHTRTHACRQTDR